MSLINKFITLLLLLHISVLVLFLQTQLFDYVQFNLDASAAPGDQSPASPFPDLLGFTFWVLLATSISSGGLIYIWFIKPLRAITQSLKTEDIELLAEISPKDSDFDKLTQSVIELFERKNQLQEEIKKRQKIETALKDREIQLSDLMSQEEQLHRNLHDDLVQALFAHGLRLEQCRNELEEGSIASVTDKLKLSRMEVNELIAKVRYLLEKNTSGVIQGSSLSKELHYLSEKGCQVSSTHFTTNLPTQLDTTLSPAQQKHVKCIVSEAISNCINHAEAEHCDITLQLNEADIVLQINDDGRGYSQENHSPGHGLKNIQERVEELYGTVEIKTEPGSGFHLLASFPYTEDHA